MFNKRGVGFVLLFKLLGVLLVILGLIPLLFEFGVVGFSLPEFISASLIGYLLGIAGVLILVTSLNDSFLGKRWLALLVALVLAIFGVYLVGVDLGYVNELFSISEFFISIALVVYGLYILVKDFI